MQKKTLPLFLLLLLTACQPENGSVTPQKQPRDSDKAKAEQAAPAEKMAVRSDALPPTDGLTGVTLRAALGRQGTTRASATVGSAPGQYMVMAQKVQGRAPAWTPQQHEKYHDQKENSFINAGNDPLSTFSIDVDTASYANIRRFLNRGSLPPGGAIRLEEMINYFDYTHPPVSGNSPLAIQAQVSRSPFHPEYRLAKIDVYTRSIDREKLPPQNLVFLVDVSGSMNSPEKLGLLQKALKMVAENLRPTDRIAIVSYAGSDRVVLESTSGKQQGKIFAAIDSLSAGGSTNAGQGLMTAYRLIDEGRSGKDGGNNRVILASDGDFNVGVTSEKALRELIEKKRKSGVYLSVLGFGMGNYRDDTMETLADNGNGNYAYIDSELEAKKVLVKEMGGTFFTVAKDVKIQVEFNPAKVGAYRLIGYENRTLTDEDFKDDRKDAGEIGAGSAVTAFYELIPAGHKDVPAVDGLKYASPAGDMGSDSDELLTVKVRWKAPSKETSQQLELPLVDTAQEFAAMDNDFRFAAAVAGWGMLLQHSDQLDSGFFTWQRCLETVRGSRGEDRNGYRAEMMRLVEKSELLQE